MLNFPANPSNNDIYSTGDGDYIYDSTKGVWKVHSATATTLTTNIVGEGANLYFTNARVYANVNQIGYAYNTYVDTKANISS